MGELEGRLDVHFYLPEFQSLIIKIKAKKYRLLGEIARFSKETTSFTEFSDGLFEYLEIAGVEIGTNTYQTTLTNVADAPSRAKMKTQLGDIVISTTRPNRGAIAQIKDDKIIASTGFSIIRELDDSVDREWMLYTLLSDLSLQQMLQRSSGGNYPAIVVDELKKIYIPYLDITSQKKMAQILRRKSDVRKHTLEKAGKLLWEFENQIVRMCGLEKSNINKICYAVKFKHLDGVIDAKRYVSEIKLGTGFTISNVCEILDRKVNVSQFGQQIIDWIRIDDLSNQPLDIEEIRTQPANEVEGTFFEIEEGDILVARLGPTILNRKIVMVRSLARTTIASAEFLVLRCKKGYNAEAVMAVLKTEYYRDLMYSHARGSTPSRYRLNKEDMLKLPFPDISEQQEQIATKANDIRNQVKSMRIQAEEDWKAAKEQFEKELLGE